MISAPSTWTTRGISPYIKVNLLLLEIRAVPYLSYLVPHFMTKLFKDKPPQCRNLRTDANIERRVDGDVHGRFLFDHSTSLQHIG